MTVYLNLGLFRFWIRIRYKEKLIVNFQMEKILTILTYVMAIFMLIALGYSSCEVHRQGKEISTPTYTVENQGGMCNGGYNSN